MFDIPVIDLSSSQEGHQQQREVAFQIDAACRETGFFTLTGHGIAPEAVPNAFATLRDFFALPLADKNQCRLPAETSLPGGEYTPYGYSGLLEENAFAFMGIPGQPSDYVEKFSAGRLILDDTVSLPFIASSLGERLRRDLKRYYTACESLAARIAKLLTIPLHVPLDYFTQRIDRSEDSMRCHFYPALTGALPSDQGMGEHTDSTLFTMLTHTSPGIQVRTRDGKWITPEFRRADDFIVNIGDLLSHWSGNQYLSTPHRVVLSAEPRYSIVFFKLTNDDEFVQAGNRQMDALLGRTAAP